MRKRSREPKPLHRVLATAAGPSLIKYLASCNPRVRSQSLQLIQSWLAAEPELLSEPDIGKLWKGLFYCLWHSDKMQNQVALINRLTSLFLSLREPLALDFFRGFLVTLRREWPGIDRLRLDKFYLMIRRFVRVVFEMFRARGWDLDIVGEYFGVLEKNGFMAEDKLRGNGVNYHIVSVFLEELKSVGFPVNNEVVDAILRPFFVAVRRSEDKILLAKIKSCVFDELVKMGRELLVKKREAVSCDGNDGDALLGFVALRMGLSDKLYEIGSGSACIQGNRKVVLGLHEEFRKLEKELESSGIEIDIPEFHAADDSDEVPQLIPIECHGSMPNWEIQTVVEASNDHEYDDGRLSKRKKANKDIEGQDKKEKKKKKKKKIRKHEKVVCETSPVAEESGDSNHSTVDAASNELKDGSDGISLNETIILNLQKQFEKVVTESESNNTPLASLTRSKRRRSNAESKHSNDAQDTLKTEDNGVANGSEKSAKKVRFAMRQNLVWTPQTPLPPENLRLPPSLTPRGSALKKGVPPGPVVEMQLPEKRMKSKKQRKKKRTAQNRPSMAKSPVSRLQQKMPIIHN